MIEWKEVGYGFEKASVGKGFIKMSVGWDSTVPKGTEAGYKANVNGNRLKRVCKTIDEAKEYARIYALHFARLALADLENA